MINKNKKNKKNNNILLNSLFKSNNFYGESLNKTNKNNLPFIYGIRHNYSIINLKYVSFFLKRVFKLIQYTINKKKNILIISNSNDTAFLINDNFTKKHKNIIFFNKEWIHGLITNNQVNTFFIKKEIKLVLIVKSTISDEYLNKELSSLKIPVISILNTNQELKNIDYPLLTNSKNIKSLYILMYLIRKLI